MDLNETNTRSDHDHYDHSENVAAWDMKNARLDHEDDHVVNVAAYEVKNERNDHREESTTANLHIEDSMDC